MSIAIYFTTEGGQGLVMLGKRGLKVRNPELTFATPTTRSPLRPVAPTQSRPANAG